jgi:GTP-binding protein
MKPIISIVGRPNVGKSTLFNRLVGYQKAIIEDIPGVTRDRNYAEFDYAGRTFILVDTGGFEPGGEDRIVSLVEEQIHEAMRESTAVIFILDGKDGLLPQDLEISRALRRSDKQVFYVVNKVDSKKREAGTSEFYALGSDKIHLISAQHGLGIGEFLDDLVASLPSQPDEEPTVKGLRLAIVGRPNVGKSSIVNQILGSDRMIVSEIPGTTRDAVDSTIVYEDKTLTLVDTAGMRRKGRIEKTVEEYSIISSIRSIERADLVNLIIDYAEGPVHQDSAIAHLIIKNGKGLCLVVNKWDLVQAGAQEKDYARLLREQIPHADFAPILFVSAKTGQNIEQILTMDITIHSELLRRISTPQLNKSVEEFLQRGNLPRINGKQLKIYYTSQARSRPPTFIFHCNYPDGIPEHYKRYLENSLRQRFGFEGAPVRLVFRKR